MGDFGLGQEAFDRLRQVGADLVVALVAFVGVDAAGRHEDRLRGGAHLAGVQRQREGEVAQHRLVGVGRVDDDVVDAGQLGIDLGLAAVVDQPLAEDVAAGEVDRLHRRVGGERLGGAALRRDAERDQVGVDAVLGQHGADRAHGDRRRQDGVAVRLDDDGVAGGERSEQAGVGVPGREGAAADHQADTAADDLVMLLHDQRRVLALRLFPAGLGRHEALLAPGVGDGFEAAVLGVRAAGLEGHHPALAGGHHHRVGDLEALRVEAGEDFQTDAGTAVGTDGLPALHRFGAGGDQCLGFYTRVADAELGAVGRGFAAEHAGLAGLAQFEGLAQVGLESTLAVVGRGFAVQLRAGHFGEGRPVAARRDRVQRAIEGGLVLFKKGVAHASLSGKAVLWINDTNEIIDGQELVSWKAMSCGVVSSIRNQLHESKYVVKQCIDRFIFEHEEIKRHL